MKINNIYKRILVTGLALFSMFFGAGNIVFPLHIGSQVGQNIVPAAIGFIISGVGVPFLALIATAQFQGDYWRFFSRLGKIPAFLLILVLMIVIGPVSALPRTGIITFNTISLYLPDRINNLHIFGIFYFFLIFAIAYKESNIINIIGTIFSPIKVVLFIILVASGIYYSSTPLNTEMQYLEAFKYSVNYGYSTMDMFGAFFFCTLVFRSLDTQIGTNITLKEKNKIIIFSCLLGGTISALVYLGFLYLGYSYAYDLRELPTETLIAFVSQKILGNFGGIFVCIAVSSACISTAVALARVCTFFIYREVFRKKLPANFCLLLVILGSYYSSTFGFQTILQLLLPLLQVIYPCLIVYSLISILGKRNYLNNEENHY